MHHHIETLDGRVCPAQGTAGIGSMPGPQQLTNISRKQLQISQLFNMPLTQIFITSAIEGYGLQILIEQIIHRLPKEKSGASRERPAPST